MCQYIIPAAAIAVAWLAICALLLDAGLARTFDSEQDCRAKYPSTVCGNVR